MTQSNITPAHDAFKESPSEKVKDFFWKNGLYLVLAAVAISAWLLFSVVALAVTVTGIVLAAVSIFVGSLSENVWRGLAAGAIAAIPVALFFLWILK